MFTLRPYQKECLGKTKNYIAAHKKQGVVVAATGTGKSVIIAEICKTFSDKRILILAHRKKLLEQIGGKITEEISFYSAGLGGKCLQSRIVCAGIQSLYNVHLKEAMPNFDICLIDECHTVNTPNEKGRYYSLSLALLQHNCALVGLTATPFRNGGKSIIDGKIFCDLIYDAGSSRSINRFIADGYLTPLISPPTKSVLKGKKIKKFAKDYSMADATRVLAPLTYDVIANNINHLQERNKILTFCTSIEHAEKTGAIFNELGFNVLVIHSQKNDNDEKINLFSNSKNIKILINVDLLTTGFDLPIIDCLFFLRPTLSPTLWIQMLGRGMRTFNGKKNCLVVDPVGNVKHFGGFFNCIDNALKDNSIALNETKNTIDKDKKKGPHEQYCPHCEAVSYAFVCEFCGKEKVKIVNETEIKVENPLKKVTWATYKKLVSKKGDAMVLVNLCYKENSKSKWASLFLIPEHKDPWIKRNSYNYIREAAPCLNRKIETKSLKTSDIVELINKKMLKKPLYIMVKKSGSYTNADKIYW